MGNDKDNVAVGLPKPGGALFWAPLGTDLPTDASTPLGEVSEDYVNLGYVTEDGLTNSTAEERNDITVWGPEVVGSSQSSYAETFTFNLVETIRPAVLQFKYGEDFVKINPDGSLSWAKSGKTLPRGVFVCDTLQSNGGEARVRRQVAGDSHLTDRSGDLVFNNSDALSEPATLQAYKFEAADYDEPVYVANYVSAPLEAATP